MRCSRRGAPTLPLCSRMKKAMEVGGSDTGLEREVAENTRAGAPVGDPVVATDEDGDVLTYVATECYRCQQLSPLTPQRASCGRRKSWTSKPTPSQLRSNGEGHGSVLRVHIRSTMSSAADWKLRHHRREVLQLTNVKEAPTFSAGETAVALEEKTAIATMR